MVDLSVSAGHQVYALSRSVPENKPDSCKWITASATEPDTYPDPPPETQGRCRRSWPSVRVDGDVEEVGVPDPTPHEPPPLPLSHPAHGNGHGHFHKERESAVPFFYGDAFKCLFFGCISGLLMLVTVSAVFVGFASG